MARRNTTKRRLMDCQVTEVLEIRRMESQVRSHRTCHQKNIWACQHGLLCSSVAWRLRLS